MKNKNKNGIFGYLLGIFVYYYDQYSHSIDIYWTIKK